MWGEIMIPMYRLRLKMSAIFFTLECVNLFLYHTVALSPSQSLLFPHYAYRGLWGPAHSHAIGISGPLIYHSCATPIWASGEGCIMEEYHSHSIPMNNHMCSKEGYNLQINTLRSKQDFFCQQYFLSAFSWKKCLYFDEYLLKFVCKGSFNWQIVITGSGNGLAPIRCQDITWTSDDPVHWNFVRSFCTFGIKVGLSWRAFFLVTKCFKLRWFSRWL